MAKSRLIWQSFLSSLGVLIYITAVAFVMNNGEKLFGKINSVFGPVFLLMLFVVSALITSTLVFGRPIYLYLNGNKKDSISLFFYTVGWLVIFLSLVFFVLWIK
ncbi:MAG: hypothetical protein WCV41_02755 [Patescibacteria group bacterium]